MNKKRIFILYSLLLLETVLTPAEMPHTAARPGQEERRRQIYETRAIHDPDGIGKFYMGREIAHVMGHEAADWLERSDRADTEAPDQVIKQMKLKPADTVADIGAGTGYFTFPHEPRGHPRQSLCGRHSTRNALLHRTEEERLEGRECGFDSGQRG